MKENEFNAFYEEHKNKKGEDYRLAVLKMDKEDIYDYLDYYHSENCFNWLQKSHQDSDKVNRLMEKNDALQKELDELKQIDDGLASNYIKELKNERTTSVLKLNKANDLIDRIEHWIKNKVPSNLININPTKKAIKDYKNESI